MVNPLLVIVGPTAVGKTAISLMLIQALGGEVVSADSRQVYRGMDIGTAKATVVEQNTVPHHLLDIRNPDEMISLGEFQRSAYAVIDSVHERGGLPLLVGGTGQYVRAVVEGWQVPEVPPQIALRSALEEEAEREGKEVVFARLQELDPLSAERIDWRNLRRVIRAIEVTTVLGRPFSELQTKFPPPYTLVQIGLTRPREILYQRVDVRIEQMFEDGFVHEVEQLLSAGYSPGHPGFSSLGYREVASFLVGEHDLEEAKMLLCRHTRQFIRRQYNWFRLTNPNITWFDMEEQGQGDVLRFAKQTLKANC